MTINTILVGLRKEHKELIDRAAALQGEVRDGINADEAARIEREHAEVLRQAADVQTRIATAEAESQPVPPVSDLAAERVRSADISDIGRRSGVPNEVINAALRDGTPVDVFRQRAFEHLATEAETRRTSSIHVSQDATETRRSNIEEALAFRLNGSQPFRSAEGAQVPLSEGARAYREHSMVDMAVEVLGERQIPRSTAAADDLFRRAFHTTSDFPLIFEGSINRVLRARYELAQPTYRRIAMRRDFRDFRPHSVLRSGDFPMLKPVGEGGEIKFGSFGESKEQVTVGAYAVQFAITRQMLVNDDIGAIDQLLGSYGTTVSLFEEITFYAMKNVNAGLGPVLLEDNKTVFHADHGNLAGAGATIGTTTLGAGRAAMRKAKNSSGNSLNVAPRTMLVGPDKETEAELAVVAVLPTKSTDVNLFSGRLDVVSTAQIAGNAWELYADPAMMPVWMWGYLQGYSAPRLRLDNPFGAQGLKVSLEHDFGAGAIDFRGGYRNPGA